jgi:hypothetical protein
MNDRDKLVLIRDLAGIIAGLQVPYSIDKRILGAAAAPWLKVFQSLNLFGWQDQESITKRLNTALKEEEKCEVGGG